MDGNELIGKDEGFYGMISDPFSRLELLHISDAKLSSTAAIKLFTALKLGNKLRVLWMTFNDVGDEASTTIAATLKDNTSLIKLNLGGNPISVKSSLHIIKALQDNNTLKELTLPSYLENATKSFLSLVKLVNQT